MYIKLTSILLAIAGGYALTSCRDSHAQADAIARIEVSDSIPESVKRAVKAVANDDSIGFASAVSYPLERPYPLRDIANEKEMRSYYHKMVDDSLKNVVAKSGPEKWGEYGWRGWSLDNGQYLWIDDGIYDVQYLSQAEKAEKDKLASDEIKSLEPSMREGWQPVTCLQDKEKGTIYRIDKSNPQPAVNPDKYRLAIYDKGMDLKSKPTSILYGEEDQGGSAINSIYTFATNKGEELTIETDCPENDSPILINPNGSEVELTKVYWRELVK